MSAAAPDPQPRRIFLSYARRDAAALAQRLYNHFQGSAWLDKYAIEPGVLWTRSIDDALESADVVLAVLTNGSYESNMCTAEHIKAMDLGKRIIPLLHQPNARIPTYLAATQYIDFTNPGSGEPWRKLQVAVSALLPAKAVPLTAQPAPRQTLVTAPPLPRNYLHRAEAITTLRSQIVTDDPGPSIALTALHGMGGIGKTVLAQALAHDEVVQNAFPDGIVWITVGREPTNDTFVRLQEVRRALGDKPDPSENLTTCQNLYRTVLRDKAALVIVDDVWHTRDIEPFLAESPRSKILFTTRDETIANDTQAQLHQTGLLTPNQSRDLLAKSSGVPPDKLAKEAGDLIRECGHLPLAISMIGAMLRNKPAPFWSHVLHLLRTADIAKIKAQFPNYPHPDLFCAIQVSVDQLEPGDRARYLSLAVLLEDMRIAPYIQRTLWNVDQFEALETRERLVSLSLAQREGDDSIRLHDLQMDYLRSQYPSKQALDLIHGALRLSSHILDSDPTQFASQLVGRLLPHSDNPNIAAFTAEITQSAPRPWLRPTKGCLHPPGDPLIRTLVGHLEDVNYIAITPDGTRAVSASFDKTLRLWDLNSGRELRTMRGHSDFVSCVAITPDGAHVVSASFDNTLILWELCSGRQRLCMKGHQAEVNSVAITPDGACAISASSDKTIKVWDLSSGRNVSTLEGHVGIVHSVAITPDGTRAVSASADRTLKLWDLLSGEELLILRGHSDVVTGVSITPDQTRIVSTSWDGSLKVWDLHLGRELLTLEGHTERVTSVAITPDSTVAVSGSLDNTLRVWNLLSGREIRCLIGHSDSVRSVAITPDGTCAISASWDHTARVWDLCCRSEVRSVQNHTRPVSSLAVSGNYARAISASIDGTLKVWDVCSGLQLLSFCGHSCEITAVAITRDGERAVSASSDKTLKVWDLCCGGELLTLHGHSNGVTGVAITPDGERAVSSSSDGTLKLWDLHLGDLLSTLSGHSGEVTSVAITADGMRAASGSTDSTVRVWNLVTARQLRCLVGHSKGVYGIAITPNGTRALSASFDTTSKVWDLDSGDQILSFDLHRNGVSAVAVTPEGCQAVSGSFDNTLKLWCLTTGALTATFTADSAIHCCAFGPDNLILAGDRLGYIHYLRLEE